MYMCMYRHVLMCVRVRVYMGTFRRCMHTDRTGTCAAPRIRTHWHAHTSLVTHTHAHTHMRTPHAHTCTLNAYMAHACTQELVNDAVSKGARLLAGVCVCVCVCVCVPVLRLPQQPDQSLTHTHTRTLDSRMQGGSRRRVRAGWVRHRCKIRKSALHGGFAQ